MKDGGSRKKNYSRQLVNSTVARTQSELSQDDCNLSFVCHLENLQLAVQNYSEDDILQLKINPEGIIVATGRAGDCGSIATMQSMKLKKCIEDGNSYKAIILELSPISCKVRVKNYTSI